VSIETIVIVNHSHVDLGYTDHQQTAMRMQCSYIDEALDIIEQSNERDPEARFSWTQEVFYPLKVWWESASAKKRERLLRAIRNGRFEVGALSVNTTCFGDQREWAYMLDSLPAKVREAENPRMLMQIDINGLPRKGLEMAWDRGVRRLWMGPNSYYGRPPMPAPCAFYWNLAPGKPMLVWCNAGYNDGTYLFNDNWREGPLPAAYDLRYRRPEPDDLFQSDDEGLLCAHAHLTERLKAMYGESALEHAQGGFNKSSTRRDYPYKVLVTSVTNQWRFDNDPPLPQLVNFVEAWNRKGLMPRLKIATVSRALDELEQSAEGMIPTFEGVWSDYWANGQATAPQEVAAAREARRILNSAEAIPGGFASGQKKQREEILYNLMRTGEHTYAAWDSAADPFSTNSMGQLAEKNVFPYRALEGAKMLLWERMQKRLNPEMGTVTLYNPTDVPKTVRLNVPRNALRGNYASLKDVNGGTYRLEYRPGRSNFDRPEVEADYSEDNVGRTFGDACPDTEVVSEPIKLAPGEWKPLTLCAETVEPRGDWTAPEIRTDAQGWPVYVAFAGAKPLVDGALANFRCIRAGGVSPRWTFKDVFNASEEEERLKYYRELFAETDAVYEQAARTEERGLIVFTQRFSHPSLRLGRRTIEIDCETERALVTVKADRLPDFTPEIFYVGFEATVGDDLPTASMTGQSFVPLQDNLPGTCRDFFAIDGWLRYGGQDNWCWFARDTSLVCIGKPRPSTRLEALPENKREFWAQVFDNTWDTNFNPNAWGRMVFRFDIMNDVPMEPGAMLEANAADAVVMLRTKNKR